MIKTLYISSLTSHEVFNMENPEAFLDVLTIRSLKERYHDNPEHSRNDAIMDTAGVTSHEELELFVRDFTIDDSISDRFAASDTDTPITIGVVCPPSNCKIPPSQQDSFVPITAKSDEVSTNNYENEPLSSHKRQNFVTSLFHRKNHHQAKDTEVLSDKARPALHKSTGKTKSEPEKIKVRLKTSRIEGKQSATLHKHKHECIEKSNQISPKATNQYQNKENIPNIKSSVEAHSGAQKDVRLESPCLKADEFYHERPKLNGRLTEVEHAGGSLICITGSEIQEHKSGSDKRNHENAKRDKRSRPSFFNLGRVLDNAFTNRKRKSVKTNDPSEKSMQKDSFSSGNMDSNDMQDTVLSATQNFENVTKENFQNSRNFVCIDVHRSATDVQSEPVSSKSWPLSFGDATTDMLKLQQGSVLNDANFDEMYLQHSQHKWRTRNQSKSDPCVDKCGVFISNNLCKTEKGKRCNESSSKECRHCNSWVFLDFAEPRSIEEVASPGDSIDSIVNSVGELFGDDTVAEEIGSVAWYEVDSDVSICDVSHHSSGQPLGRSLHAPLCGIIEDSSTQMQLQFVESAKTRTAAKVSKNKGNKNRRRNSSASYNDDNSPHNKRDNKSSNGNNKHNNNYTKKCYNNTNYNNRIECCSCNRHYGNNNCDPETSARNHSVSKHSDEQNSPNISESTTNLKNLPESKICQQTTRNLTENTTENDNAFSDSDPCFIQYQNYSSERESITQNKNENSFSQEKVPCSCNPFSTDTVIGHSDDPVSSSFRHDENGARGEHTNYKTLTMLNEGLVRWGWSAARKLDRIAESLTQILTYLTDFNHKCEDMTTGYSQSHSDTNDRQRTSWTDANEMDIAHVLDNLQYSLETMKDEMFLQSVKSEMEESKCCAIARCLSHDVSELIRLNPRELPQQLSTLIRSHLGFPHNNTTLCKNLQASGKDPNNERSAAITPDATNSRQCFTLGDPFNASNSHGQFSHVQTGVYPNTHVFPVEEDTNTKVLLDSLNRHAHQPHSDSMAKASHEHPLMTSDQTANSKTLSNTGVNSNMSTNSNLPTRHGNFQTHHDVIQKAQSRGYWTNDSRSCPHCATIADSRHGNSDMSQANSFGRRATDDSRKGQRRKQGCYSSEWRNVKDNTDSSNAGTRDREPDVINGRPEILSTTRETSSTTSSLFDDDYTYDNSIDGDYDVDEREDFTCHVDDLFRSNRLRLDADADDPAEMNLCLQRHLQSVERLHHGCDDIIETVVTRDGKVLVSRDTTQKGRGKEMDVAYAAQLRHHQLHGPGSRKMEAPERKGSKPVYGRNKLGLPVFDRAMDRPNDSDEYV